MNEIFEIDEIKNVTKPLLTEEIAHIKGAIDLDGGTISTNSYPFRAIPIEGSFTYAPSRLFTDEQIALMKAPTPEEALENYVSYDGQKTDLTGVKWPYFKDLLNTVIGIGKWVVKIDWTNIRFEKDGDKHSCSVPVTCQIIESISGGYAVKWEYQTMGGAYFETKGPYADLVKAAQTDGVKKCFSMLGFCDDVYSGKSTFKKVEKQTPKPSRAGTIEITEEEKKLASECKKKITNCIKSSIEKLKAKKETGDPLSNSQENIINMTKEDMFRFFGEILIKAAGTGDKQISFKPGYAIYRYSDIHTLYEWQLLEKEVLSRFQRIVG